MRIDNAAAADTRLSKRLSFTFKILFVSIICLGSACQADKTPPQESDKSSPKTLAKKILGHELKVPENEIEIISVENMTWSDSSLGCPEPGKFYAQMLVDGHLVVTAYEGHHYNIHIGNGGGRVCYLPEGILPTPEKN